MAIVSQVSTPWAQVRAPRERRRGPYLHEHPPGGETIGEPPSRKYSQKDRRVSANSHLKNKRRG